MAVSRADVVQAGIRVLDEVGLEGLTLRRVAAELGISPPTLHWHLRDKRELLDLMAEAILAETLSPEQAAGPAPGQPWWDWLRLVAVAQFDALVAHRDAALVVAGNRPTAAALPQIERAVGVLVAAGFPPGEAMQVLFTLGAYVGGSAVEWQAEAARASAVQADGEVALLIRDGSFPHLTVAVKDLVAHPPRATFEHGLDLIVAGLRSRHAALVPDPA